MAGAPAPSPNPSQPPGTGSDGPLFSGPGLTTYLDYFLALYGILEIAGILPDPISLLESFFEGRPREQATIQIAQRLLGSKNPSGKILGVEWLKMLHDFDIVISTSGTGVQIIDAVEKQFTDGLVAQGVSLGRARNILVNAYSTAAQQGAALEPELTEALNSQLTLYGPPSFNTLADQYTKVGQADGYTGDKLNRFVLRQILIRQPVDQLDQISIQPINPPTPPGDQPPGGTTPLPIPVPIQPPGTDPGDGDDETICCGETQTALANILAAIQANGIDPACCAELVAAINAVATAVSAAGGTGSPGAAPTPEPSPPIDLTGITTELTAIATAIAALPPSPGVDLTALVAAVTNLGNTIANAITAAQANLTKWMETLPPHTARSQAISQQVAALGFIDGGLLQLISQ